MVEEINTKILKFMIERKINPAEFIKLYKNCSCNIKKTMDSLNIYQEETKQEIYKSIGHQEAFDNALEYIEKQKIKLVNISQDIYPSLLKEIYDPPVMLFTRGDMGKLNNFSIAVVGSRKCTSYGKDAARQISKSLSMEGITVVSGLAIGIDSYAHSSAIMEKGGSIAVLGCGIDIIYPPENRVLFNKVLENGLIISEFIPGTPPLRNNFPIRNRIISGLSRGVILIEAPEKSGAMITCDLALKQDREVFAIPGNIFNKSCRGNHKLIKQGAKLTENINDILEEFSCYFNERTELSAGIKKEKEKNFLKLSKNKKKVLSVIEHKQKTLESIALESKLEISEVIVILSWLELKGLIKECSFGTYCMVF